MPLPVLTSARGSLDGSILVVSSRESSLLDTGSSTKGSPHATRASAWDRGEVSSRVALYVSDIEEARQRPISTGTYLKLVRVCSLTKKA